MRVLETGGEIYDEYGDRLTLEEFKQLVEIKKGAPNNHTIYCRTHHPDEDSWLDNEGHSFTNGGFS